MPKLIETWKDLVGLESEDYYLEIDVEKCSGWINPKDHVKYDDKDYWKHNEYLSTHTFYGTQYKNYTKILRSFGFDVQLKNWDGETEWVT